MENKERTDVALSRKLGSLNLQGTRTLIITGVILAVLGIGGSYFFSKTIEKFFWEARTKSAVETVNSLGENLLPTDPLRWEETSANERLTIFATGIKKSRSNIVAIKIYTPNGSIAWTDLKSVQAGYAEPGIETELQDVATTGSMIKDAGDLTKKELSKTNLLEVWTTIKGTNGEVTGFAELYFDSSDILAFITEIEYSIWITIFIVLVIILILLKLAFRKQDELIVRQAHNLSNIIEKSPIGIYMVDQKGIITTINKKMFELLKEKDVKKILGQSVFALPSIQKMDKETEIHEALLGRSFDTETSLTDDDGTEIYRRYQGTPLFAEDGRTVLHVLFMVEDITEHKRLEQTLSKQAEKMETTISDRTKALEDKVSELERFERLTVGREVRMTELKQQIEKMRVKLESLGVNVDSL